MTTVQASADRPSADTDHRLDALLLERWERDPALPAIVSGDTVVTVGELRERVLRTAAALRAHGVRAGDRVVIHHERSVEFVVAVLGAMFAGAAHAALGVDDPPRRILRAVQDCEPRAVLTDSALRDRFSDVPGLSDLVVLTDEECATYPPTPEPVRGNVSADDPVAVIYTSGSTGRPKASLISHRALVSRITALQTTHRMDERDRMMHHTVCTFDMYLGELYWPLLAGATVVVAAPGRHRDADHLAALIRDQGITTVYFGVSQLELFLLTRDPAERYDGLRQVLTGGEPLGPDLVKRFHSRSTASLTNIYGPSECTIYSTAWLCPRDPDLDTVLIGPAIQDTELWILDQNGAPVPDGEPGELYIGGAGVALGYLNRPELTAERFLGAERFPDAPAVSPDSRLYRSGDLVRARSDGALEFLGRADRQVKIRGIRIEPGEIEETAKRCTGVRQAAVVAHGSGAEKHLAAFVVPEKGCGTGQPAVVRTRGSADLAPAVHGAVGHRGGGRTAADAERQARPPSPGDLGGEAVGRIHARAARTPCARRSGCGRGSRHGRASGCGERRLRGVVRGPPGLRRRPGRRLLRPGRGFLQGAARRRDPPGTAADGHPPGGAAAGADSGRVQRGTAPHHGSRTHGLNTGVPGSPWSPGSAKRGPGTSGPPRLVRTELLRRVHHRAVEHRPLHLLAVLLPEGQLDPQRLLRLAHAVRDDGNGHVGAQLALGDGEGQIEPFQ
ncbi:amino acid adenylation domain-containing protein [Streptomyces phaeochromogenes]|nr:amino acid adenylation domain-containing protein [Streptomyces phaeochromogenes]